jgi:hypothetical protein
MRGRASLSGECPVAIQQMGEKGSQSERGRLLLPVA